jgi:hypothetical protein
VESVRSGFVSHGSGIATRVDFPVRFCPNICARAPSVDALIPALYLKGISTGDFSEALAAIFGRRSQWALGNQYRAVEGRLGKRLQGMDASATPSQKRYVYWWADGVYFNVRLDEERTCVLVLIGATEDGTKELLAVVDRALLNERNEVGRNLDRSGDRQVAGDQRPNEAENSFRTPNLDGAIFVARLALTGWTLVFRSRPRSLVHPTNH